MKLSHHGRRKYNSLLIIDVFKNGFPRLVDDTPPLNACYGKDVWK